MRIKYLVPVIVFAAITAICAIYLEEVTIYALIASAALLVISVAVLVVFPGVFHTHYRYMITDDKVDVRRGIIIHTHTVVPIERIHQVKVTKGPISRMYGLADVIVTTAGGDASIEYLENDVADEVAEQLNAVVDRILRERHRE